MCLHKCEMCHCGRSSSLKQKKRIGQLFGIRIGGTHRRFRGRLQWGASGAMNCSEKGDVCCAVWGDFPSGCEAGAFSLPENAVASCPVATFMSQLTNSGHFWGFQPLLVFSPYRRTSQGTFYRATQSDIGFGVESWKLSSQTG